MKSLIFLLSILLTALIPVNSQTAIKKSSLSTDGGSAVNGNITVTYTVGELAVREIKNGNTGLSEGFISPDIRVALKAEDYGELQGVNIFPNPVKDNLHISWPFKHEYEIHLFDITGKEIFVKTDNTSNSTFNLSGYPKGIYLLGIVDRKNRKIRTFKVQKK
jgi:hypothetical protein